MSARAEPWLTPMVMPWSRPSSRLFGSGTVDVWRAPPRRTSMVVAVAEVVADPVDERSYRRLFTFSRRHTSDTERS